MTYDPESGYETFPCRFCFETGEGRTVREDGEPCDDCLKDWEQYTWMEKAVQYSGHFTCGELEELRFIRPEMRRFA